MIIPWATPKPSTTPGPEAGFDGTISPTLVNKLRSSLGLAGNIRGNTKNPETGVNGQANLTGKKRGRPRKETSAAVIRPTTGEPVHSPERP